MDKYLVHLIKQNKRIIIPEIGAFIVRQEDPLEIGFNGLLTFNDGMLTDHISKVEGISNQEAVAKVEEYKNQLLKDLEQKKEIILQDIGKLNLDESGEKVFVSWKDVGKKAEAKAEAKEEEKKAAAAAAEEEKKKAEAKAKEEEEKKAAAAEEEEKKKAEAEAKTMEEEKKAEAAAAAEEEKKKAEAKAKEEAEKKKAAAEKKKAEAKAKEEAEKKKAATATTVEKKKAEAEAMAKKEEEKKAAAEAEKKKKEEAEAKAKFEEEKKKEVAAEKEKAAFTLDDSLTDVDVDATKDATDDTIKTEKEAKPPFTLDETVPPETPEPEKVPSDKTEPPAEKKYVVKESRERFSTPPPAPRPVEKKTEKPTRKRRRWMIPVGIVLGIIIILAAGWFIYPEKIRTILNIESSVAESQVDEQPGQVAEEEVPEQSDVTEQPVTEEEIPVEVTPPEDVEEEVVEAEVIEQPTPSGKRYYIIAGCFEYLENANNYVTSLKDKGFNSELIGMRNNLHIVSFDVFDTKQAALEEMARIREQTEPKAWVLYY